MIVHVHVQDRFLGPVWRDVEQMSTHLNSAVAELSRLHAADPAIVRADLRKTTAWLVVRMPV